MVGSILKTHGRDILVASVTVLLTVGLPPIGQAFWDWYKAPNYKITQFDLIPDAPLDEIRELNFMVAEMPKIKEELITKRFLLHEVIYKFENPTNHIIKNLDLVLPDSLIGILYRYGGKTKNKSTIYPDENRNFTIKDIEQRESFKFIAYVNTYSATNGGKNSYGIIDGVKVDITGEYSVLDPYEHLIVFMISKPIFALIVFIVFIISTGAHVVRVIKS